VFRGRRRRAGLHLAQTTVNAEREIRIRCAGACLRREHGLRLLYVVCTSRIAERVCVLCGDVVLQIGLREAVTVDFTPIPVCHSQLVAAAVCFSGRDQLVGGIVGEGFAECLAVQPGASRGNLCNVADSYSFDNMFS